MILLLMITATGTVFSAEPTEKEVLTAMRKATEFMANTVSNRGGYLWAISEDFSDSVG